MNKNEAAEMIMIYLKTQIEISNQKRGEVASIEFTVVPHLTHNVLEFYYMYGNKKFPYTDRYGYIEIVSGSFFKGIVKSYSDEYAINSMRDLELIFGFY